MKKIIMAVLAIGFLPFILVAQDEKTKQEQDEIKKQLDEIEKKLGDIDKQKEELIKQWETAKKKQAKIEVEKLSKKYLSDEITLSEFVKELRKVDRESTRFSKRGFGFDIPRDHDWKKMLEDRMHKDNNEKKEDKNEKMKGQLLVVLSAQEDKEDLKKKAEELMKKREQEKEKKTEQEKEKKPDQEKKVKDPKSKEVKDEVEKLTKKYQSDEITLSELTRELRKIERECTKQPKFDRFDRDHFIFGHENLERLKKLLEEKGDQLPEEIKKALEERVKALEEKLKENKDEKKDEKKEDNKKDDKKEEKKGEKGEKFGLIIKNGELKIIRSGEELPEELKKMLEEQLNKKE